jgi:folate-binding Fe-S cluster repair protein YgfZ
MSYSTVAADHVVDWTRLAARGSDARTFLQGQLSCDLLALSPGESAAGLLLSPSGDVVTSVVCHIVPEGVDVIVRAELAEVSLVALRRFLMRTDCQITLDSGGEGPYATVGEQVLWGEPGPSEFARPVAAHTFGRGFVSDHVSFSKGCFTGQELVGRLDARGARVPFRLARVIGDDLDAMERVTRSAGPSGERGLQGLTTVVNTDRFIALALVHRTLLAEALEGTIDGVHVEVLHE